MDFRGTLTKLLGYWGRGTQVTPTTSWIQMIDRVVRRGHFTRLVILFFFWELCKTCVVICMLSKAGQMGGGGCLIMMVAQNLAKYFLLTTLKCFIVSDWYIPIFSNMFRGGSFGGWSLLKFLGKKCVKAAHFAGGGGVVHINTYGDVPL